MYTFIKITRNKIITSTVKIVIFFIPCLLFPCSLSGFSISYLPFFTLNSDPPAKVFFSYLIFPLLSQELTKSIITNIAKHSLDLFAQSLFSVILICGSVYVCSYA